MYLTLREAYGSTTFKVQLVITMLVNFGVNFGITYANMSAYRTRPACLPGCPCACAGRPAAAAAVPFAPSLTPRTNTHPLGLSPPGSLGTYPNPAAWPGIPAVRLNTAIGSCLALDLLLTTFAMGFFCTLLATGGAQREVRNKKCQVLAPQAFLQGYWLYTPVVLRDLFARSLAMGLYNVALAGAPTFLLAWASIGDGLFNGYSYTVFKGVWCMLVSVPLYSVIFPAAIDRRCFPELEFEELLQRVEGREAAAAEKAADRYNAVEAPPPGEATKFTAL